MKKIFSLLALFIALGLTSAKAELAEVQVGSIGTSFSSEYPLYTMSPFSQDFTLYKQSQLANIEAGSKIKEITYFGYKTSSYAGVFTVKAYLANTEQTTFNDASAWMTAAPDGDGTVIDESKMTKFAEYTWDCSTTFGSTTAPVEVFTLQSDEGFTYDGTNLLIYLSMEKVSGSNGNYTNFALASQSGYQCVGAYRQGYSYSINNATWSYPSGWNIPNIPVVKFGVQVGGGEETIDYAYVGQTASGQYTAYSPNNSMYAQSEVINLYTKDLLGGIAEGSKIKEFIFNGYSTNDKSPTFTYDLYVANTTSDDPTTLLSGGTSSDIDLTKFTKFGTVVKEAPKPAYSVSDPGEMLKFESADGFVYEGGNLALYVRATSTSTAYYWMYLQKATNATKFNAKILMRTGNSESMLEGSTWSSSTDGTNIAAMTVGIATGDGGGTIPTISSTVSGRVVASTSSMSYIEGATVTITETPAEGEAQIFTTTTDTRGQYSITVDPVDTKATYTLKVEKEGYETYNYPTPIDLKGGNVALSDIPLIKLPVPATIKGTVKNSVTNAAVSGATVSFNGTTVTSGTEGNYSIAVDNIEALTAMTLTASATGYLPYSMNLTGLVGGDNNIDININPIPELPGEGTQIGSFNDINNYSYYAPIYPLTKYTASETVYPAAMFEGVETGTKFSSISFYGYYAKAVATPDPDEGDDDWNDPWFGMKRKADDTLYREYEIKAYMVNTDQATIGTTTSIDYSNLTPIYEGTVQWPMLGSKNAPTLTFTIPFETPFTYEGGNVAFLIESINTVKPGADQDGGTVPYFCVDPNYSNNVIYKEASQENGFIAGEWKVPSSVGNPNGVPVMKLGDYVASGTVSGIVTDKATGEALEGVEVLLQAEGIESVAGTTDADGFYSLTLRQVDYDIEYTLGFSYGDYYDETVEVTFTASTLEQTIDVQMEKPVEILTGQIIGSVTDSESSPIEGVTVTLSVTPADSEETEGNIATTTTAYDGNFTIDVADLDLTATYTLSFSMGGYEPASSPAVFEYDDWMRGYVAYVYVELEEKDTSAVSLIGADFNGAIYTVTGICINRNATIEDVKALPQGIYIIEGKKVVIKD